jgi:hypothetical protein
MPGRVFPGGVEIIAGQSLDALQDALVAPAELAAQGQPQGFA